MVSGQMRKVRLSPHSSALMQAFDSKPFTCASDGCGAFCQCSDTLSTKDRLLKRMGIIKEAKIAEREAFGNKYLVSRDLAKAFPPARSEQ